MKWNERTQSRLLLLLVCKEETWKFLWDYSHLKAVASVSKFFGRMSLKELRCLSSTTFSIPQGTNLIPGGMLCCRGTSQLTITEQCFCYAAEGAQKSCVSVYTKSTKPSKTKAELDPATGWITQKIPVNVPITGWQSCIPLRAYKEQTVHAKKTKNNKKPFKENVFPAVKSFSCQEIKD